MTDGSVAAPSPAHRLDFICIFAPRSGTTWLWEMLRRHPEIWVPPRKELHFFDASYRYAAPRFMAGRSLAGRLFGLQAHNLDFKRRFAGDLARAIATGDAGAVRWLVQFYLGTYTDDDYLRLFRAQPGRLNGEITPSYGILDVDDIRRVHRVAPKAKIVLLLRDPVDRAWSALKYRRLRRGATENLERLDEVIPRLESRGQLARGDYRSAIDRWHSVYPADAFVYAFYDDISARPDAMLRELVTALGVRNTTFDFGAGRQGRVNPSSAGHIPPEIERYLARQHLPMLHAIADLGPRVQEWIERAERAAGEPSAV